MFNSHFNSIARNPDLDLFPGGAQRREIEEFADNWVQDDILGSMNLGSTRSESKVESSKSSIDVYENLYDTL